MASSNIKLFDENKGNMLNDTEFNISTQRLNGLQTGVASSQLQNKAMYQASLMAYAIAQLMLANGKNANDTDAVSTFVNNLLASIVQKVADKATMQDVKAGTIGKWISSELLKSNNEAIDAALAAKADAEDVTALAAALGSSGKNARITWGSYNGTGTYGIGNKTTITPGLYPVLVCVGSPSDLSYTSWPWFMMRPCTGAQTYGGYQITVDWTDTSVSWYGTHDAEQQMNRSGSVYYYVALGYDKDAEAAG